MKHPILLLAVFGVVSLPLQPAYSQNLPPLEDIMSEDEMAETGVDHLTAEEREALRRWLGIFVERDAKFVMQRFRKEMKAEEKARAKAREAEEKARKAREREVMAQARAPPRPRPPRGEHDLKLDGLRLHLQLRSWE